MYEPSYAHDPIGTMHWNSGEVNLKIIKGRYLRLVVIKMTLSYLYLLSTNFWHFWGVLCKCELCVCEGVFPV